jgi:flagellar hook protein FlgE
LVDADGNESAPSAPFAMITTSGTPGVDQTIALNNLPPADGSTFLTRRLYRTDNTGTGDYHFVANLDQSSPAYSDSASDAQLLALPGAAVLNEDTLALGAYSYYVTFYNTLTGLESQPTAVIGPVSVANGDRVRLDNLPQPTTPDFNSLRIYRNLSADNSVFYRVDQLPTGVTSYIDAMPDAAIAVPGNEVNLDGPPINFGMPLVDVVVRDGATYTHPFQEGTLTFTGRKGGRALGAKDLQITSTTTVLDLLNFMNQAMGIQEAGGDPNAPIPGSPGGTITADSRLQLTSNMGVQNELEIDISDFQLTPTGGPTDAISLPFATVQEANGEGAVADFVVYDSLGVPIPVRLTTVMESQTNTSTTYRWFADSSDNDPASGAEIAVGTGTITFDGEGNVVSVSEETVTIDRANIASASPLEFDLDFSQLSGLADNESTLNAPRQDGSAAGTLTSFIVTESGRIVGVFSNGVSRDLGQLRLARFANNDGLRQVGENLFDVGVNSGLPIEGNPDSQGIGSITSGAVELSNTDIGHNLIELILASTQYRGSTRVISAAQELFDELLALRR